MLSAMGGSWESAFRSTLRWFFCSPARGEEGWGVEIGEGFSNTVLPFSSRIRNHVILKIYILIL